MKTRGRSRKKQCPLNSKKTLQIRANFRAASGTTKGTAKSKSYCRTRPGKDNQSVAGTPRATSATKHNEEDVSDSPGRFLDFRVNFGEHSFVRLPSQVLEPLVCWRRVLVKDGNGEVIPLGSDGKPISDANSEQSTSSANVQLQYAKPTSGSPSSELNRTRERNLLKEVKKELNTTLSSTFEEIHFDDKRISCGFTRKRSQRGEACNADDSIEITKKRSRRCPSSYAESDFSNPDGNVIQQSSYSIESNSNVYAVYFGTYYAATVLSGDDYEGYKVKFLSDSVVKNVPPEAVVPLNLVRVGQECMVGENAGIIAGAPVVLSKGLFTVSLLDQNNKAEKNVYVRWFELSFLLRTWQKERSRRMKQKVAVTSSNIFIKCELNTTIDGECSSSNAVNVPEKRRRQSKLEQQYLTRSPRALRRRQPRLELTVGGKQEDAQKRNYLSKNTFQSTPRWRRTPLKEETFVAKDPTLFYPLWPMYDDPDPEVKTLVSLNNLAEPVELSAILKMFLPSGKRLYNSFLVTLNNHPWHCQYRVASSNMSSHMDAHCFEKREKLIAQMTTAMRQRDPVGFRQHYPHYDQRVDFKKEWRVNLRIAEAMINRRLSAFHIAPIFIESWTRRLPTQIYFDYLPRSTLSVRVYREMQEASAKLRWRYPARADGCLCQGGKCELGQCPCLVYKEKGAVMICGQACGCNDSCPSSYLKKERQVPLVLFHTRYKGWGVLTPVEIPAGTFVGLYTGHITDVENEVLVDNTYVFEINQQVENGVGRYAVDGTWSGNISRFFNHSCVDPTVVAKVLFTRGNLVTHDLAFFTTRDVHIGEELTFCYSNEIMQQRSSGITCRHGKTCKKRGVAGHPINIGQPQASSLQHFKH
ncbi:hypothetical protein Y032_0141g2243 [Ancylostoma ceylanicum]|uniref:SET domain-containing protein n=1 Tax=Ancylostoma ceylanicum TaxID=53326 RepID=A0A016T437_9BILA|nr:hypothetical protein Y032_0141g2243 [Ancylostoma ceylanicum]